MHQNQPNQVAQGDRTALPSTSRRRSPGAARELLLTALLTAPGLAQTVEPARPLPPPPTPVAAAAVPTLRDASTRFTGVLSAALQRSEQLAQESLEGRGQSRELRVGAYPVQARILGRVPVKGDIFTAYREAQALAVEQRDVRIWLVGSDIDFPTLSRRGVEVLNTSSTAELVVVADDAVARALRIGLVGVKEVPYRPEPGTNMGEDIDKGKNNFPDKPTGIEGLAEMRVGLLNGARFRGGECGTSMFLRRMEGEPQSIHRDTDASTRFFAVGIGKGESKGKLLGGEDYAVFAHLNGNMSERQLPPFHPNEAGRIREEIGGLFDFPLIAGTIVQVIETKPHGPFDLIAPIFPPIREALEREQRHREAERQRIMQRRLERQQELRARLREIEQEDARGPKLLRSVTFDISVGRDPKSPTKLGEQLPTEGMQKRLERYHRWLTASLVTEALGHDAGTQRALTDIEQSGGPFAVEVASLAAQLTRGLSDETVGLLRDYYRRAIRSAGDEGREELRSELAALESDIATIDGAKEPVPEGELKYSWTKFKSYSAPAKRVLPAIIGEWLKQVAAGR